MSEEVHFDLCPETGIGCVLVGKGADSLKIDLMPDEAAGLRNMVKSGDLNGAKAMLAEIDSRAEETLDSRLLEALAREMN